MLMSLPEQVAADTSLIMLWAGLLAQNAAGCMTPQN